MKFKQFKMNIQFGNEAMQTSQDIAKALRKVADRVEREEITGGTIIGSKVFDENGNSVGRWEVT